MAAQPKRSRRRTPLPGYKVRGSKTGRPIMALLDLMSRRWLLRIVWELRAGPLKFRALQAASGELSPTLLNRRLKELRDAGLVDLSPEGYHWTDLGRTFGVAIQPLSAWAEKWADAVRGRSA